MKFNDIINRLSEKQQNKDEKTNEDLDGLNSSDEQLLTDEQLTSVAGGVDVRNAKALENEVNAEVSMSFQTVVAGKAGAAGKAGKVSKKVIK